MLKPRGFCGVVSEGWMLLEIVVVGGLIVVDMGFEPMRVGTGLVFKPPPRGKLLPMPEGSLMPVVDGALLVGVVALGLVVYVVVVVGFPILFLSILIVFVWAYFEFGN